MAYGTLEVVLVDAKNLHNTAGLLGKMDPYVSFSVKTQGKRSTVAKGQGVNPEWNESFLFTVTDDVTELRLKIMDKDTLSSDDFVGEACNHSPRPSIVHSRQRAFHQLHTMLSTSTRNIAEKSN
ncbi:hypothetical protein ACLB2K_074160 [Fragaria x ananassa]